jgi:hypothetical protein
METGQDVCFKLGGCLGREGEERDHRVHLKSTATVSGVFGNPAAILQQGISNLQCTPESRDALGRGRLWRLEFGDGGSLCGPCEARAMLRNRFFPSSISNLVGTE